MERAVVRGQGAPRKTHSSTQELAALVSHALLDHLVRPLQHRWGNREPKGLGRLDVNHELELRGLLHGQISRLSAFEDPIDVRGCAAHLVIEVDAIRHQPTTLREVAAVADRWELLFQRQL